MTRAVNLRKEPYDVYIGRPGKGQKSIFGNPVVRNKKCPVCGKVHTEKGSTLPCYRIYLFRKIQSDPEFKAEVKALKGKTLGCFCKPAPCHGDILARACEWLNSEDIND